MSDYYYYHLMYPDGTELEAIVEETAWKINIYSPDFLEDVYHLTHSRDINNKWVNRDWEFIVIDDKFINKKIKLGFNHFTEFPPGYYEK